MRRGRVSDNNPEKVADVFYGRSLVSIRSLKFFLFSTSWLLLNSGTLNYPLFFVRELQDNRDLIHADLKQNKHNNHFGVEMYTKKAILLSRHNLDKLM